MPIILASKLIFTDPPRCQECKVIILPYGKSEPFAVDNGGHPYCREHGVLVEGAYPELHAKYKSDRRAERLAALRGLDNASAEIVKDEQPTETDKLASSAAVHLVALHRTPARQMQGFVDALGANAQFFWMIMPDVWVAATYLTTQQLNAALLPHLCNTDRLLIVCLRPDYMGHHTRETWQWLNVSRDMGWFG